MIYENKHMKVIFEAKSGGFPSMINIKYPSEEISSLNSDKPFLRISLNDGRIAVPFLPENFKAVESSIEGACRIQFDGIRFKDQNACIVDDFILSMRYEFWDDGTVFVQSYFTVDNYVKRPGISEFKFDFPLNFNKYDQINVPFGATPDLREDIKYVELNDHTEKGIIPSFNFNCKRADGLAGYFEVFMENNQTLSQDRNDAETTISWNEKSPTVSWNFQNREVGPFREFPWEWRNQWGWLFTAPPAFRRLPPMRMYHLIDYFKQRIPSERQIEQIAAAGADVIILHEQWRLDVRSSSFPYDRERLLKIIELAHKRDIRVVLYMRGHTEINTVEDYCNWFSLYLRNNWDGVYMDFGGVTNTGRDISGNMHFRQHYLKLRRIRQQIGEHGLFYSHTGNLSSAVGLTPNIIDGYTAGEGENGSLSRSRYIHECLSGSYVTAGSFWTAAFPHYGGERMVLFMAASGQYPHAPLGIQFKSSSLAHPNTPGINDRYLRPLWKLWGTFKGMSDVDVFNDFNSRGILKHAEMKESGAYLMIDRVRKSALLIMSNFTSEKKTLTMRVVWNKIGIVQEADRLNIWRLAPTLKSPGYAEKWDDSQSFSVEVEAYGCAAFLMGEAKQLAGALKEFETPYSLPSSEVAAYHEIVRKQKHLRQMGKIPSKNLFIKVEIPEPPVTFICGTSFYSVIHKIGTFDANNNFSLLGYLTKNGFQKEKPSPEEWIWAGESSPWISLRHLFPGGGKQKIAIKSFGTIIKKTGDYFHSLIELVISPEPDGDNKNAYRLTYLNEVEPERETLHFEVNLESFSGIRRKTGADCSGTDCTGGA